MAAKRLLFGDEARTATRGTPLSSAVKATLGAKGRNAILDKKWGPPTLSKDGVTVAKEIDLPDP